MTAAGPSPAVVEPAPDAAPDASQAGPAPLGAIRVAKGHGTENDFVLVPDPDGRLDLGPALVARLCDRRAGLGGDGLVRVVRSATLPEGVGLSGEAEWFMDYRNADGSLAEMCGNGIRVFVAYLEHLGLVRLADGETLPVGTRAGVLRVRRDGDLLAADLGPWRVVGGAYAVAAGTDATVEVPGVEADSAAVGAPDGVRTLVALPGLRIDVGNPHTVVALPSAAMLAAADLTDPPRVRPVPPAGTNVELTVPLHDSRNGSRHEPGHEAGHEAGGEPGDESGHASGAGVGHLRMRVHERGVGETRSCGTGAAAAVLATRAWAGPTAPRVWYVDVPGGRLRVTVPADDVLAGPRVELAGPATIVAEGTLDPGWLAATTG